MENRNEDGLALSWVLAVMMFCFLLVTSALFLTSASHRQVVAETKRQQAFLTSRSVAHAMAAEFLNPSSGSADVKHAVLKALEEQMGTDKTITLSPVKLTGLSSRMGECSIQISYHKDIREMEILAIASIDGEIENACVHLNNEIPGFIEGGFYGIKTGRLKAYHLVSSVQSGLDVWVTGSRPLDIAANPADVTGQNPGTVYSCGDVIQSFPLSGDENPVLGSLVSEGDILLTNPDNCFSIESTSPGYTLYAYCGDTGEKGRIRLCGAIRTDQDVTNPGCIAGGRIELTGPHMEINSVVAGYQEVLASDGIWFTNNIYSKGRITLEGGTDGIRIGSEEKSSAIMGSDVLISGNLAGSQEDGIARIYADITAFGDGTEGGNVVIDATGPVEIYGDVSYSNTLWISDYVTIHGEAVPVLPHAYGRGWVFENRMPEDGQAKLSGILAVKPQIVSSESQELLLENEYDFVYRLEKESAIREIFAQGEGNSFLVVADGLRLNLFDSSQSGESKGSIVLLDGGSLIMDSKEGNPFLNGNVYGNGRLVLEKGTSMEGICNPGVLELEEDVTIAVSNGETDSSEGFSDNWMLVGYGRGNHADENE